MPIRVVPLVDPDRSATSHRLVWLAVGVDGSPVGTAFLRVFTRAGQEHLAELDLRVHPAERRAGVGSALLDAAVAAARADGRRTVIAQPDPGSAGEEFLPARGFR
ncbi:acetyltransferase, partial [Streptomyces sp. AcH 505]|uniref:GNAT family N-acetyltransferase n=1 Tax=Streptomyces sp. AcH 505 TaxID=352211 RepID=UPI000591E907